MSGRYLIHVPNPQFQDRVMGVQFNKGKATVDENSIDETLGYNVEEVALRMKRDFGYEVEEIVSHEARVPAKIETIDEPAPEAAPVVKTSRKK